jgi:hypothetical protein
MIKNFMKSSLLSIIDNSYWITLPIAIICLILYIAGMKKAGKYVSVSFVVYFILQCLKVAI